MIKKMEYKVPVMKSEVIGEEVIIANIVVCDVCDAPAIVYVELRSVPGKWYKSEPTGRESPFKIFGHYTTRSNRLQACDQCHKVLCNKCFNGSHWDIWDQSNNHHGTLHLCKLCTINRSGDIKKITDMIAKANSIQKDFEEVTDKLVTAYDEYKHR
jgi:hypothetical protein